MNLAAETQTRADDFRPRWWLRHPQLQSALATKSPRRRLWLRRGSTMEAAAREYVLDCGGGVRLVGYHSPQPAGRAPRGLAVLIHGWEGCHDSAYLYSMACRLYAQDWSVFRLNLRDHGGTHALNPEPFHSARLDEVLGALRAVRALDAVRPLVVIGYSLGGNFALRVGLYGPAAGVQPQLAVGVSPSINPGATLEAIDRGPVLIRHYFLDKWRKTLRAKAAAWPGRYDFSAYRGITSFVATTRRFAVEHTEYASYEDYLAAYTLTPRMLMNAPTPLALLTAQDDPVIPFRDFAGLHAQGSVLACETPARGGHCGFIENLALECWAERKILDWLERFTS
ncbi:MAG: alpha/beta fold hydrolase [Nevskia sp.]|nr:alpha/beta fold hydrolase [Nevskia sp.]